MELRINLDNPADIHNALVLLNSIRVASNIAPPRPPMPDFGADTLANSAAPAASEPPAPAPAPLPVAPKPPAPAPVAEPEPVAVSPAVPAPIATAAGGARATATAPAEAGAEPVKRGRGRPRKNATAEAMGAPVGVVLAGMPARDLAAALGEDTTPAPELVTVDDLAAALGLPEAVAEPEPAPVVVSAVDEDFASLRGPAAVEPEVEPIAPVPDEPEVEPIAPVPDEPEEVADVDEPDEEEPDEEEPDEEEPDEEEPDEEEPDEEEPDEDDPAVEAAAQNTVTAFSDADLFGTPPPIADPAGDQYDTMSRSELELAWRAEGARRANIHWMRNLIESLGAKVTADLTREALMDALRNPEKYMPPKAA